MRPALTLLTVGGIRDHRKAGGAEMTTQMFTGFRVATVVVFASVGLLAAPPARADNHVHYTSPTATSQWPPCDSEHPCELRWLAEEFATNDDTIVLAPGTYGTAAHPLGVLGIDRALTLRGEAGRPRPKLYFDSSDDAGIEMCGGSLVHLEIQNPAGSGFTLGSQPGCKVPGPTPVTINRVAASGGAGCWLTRSGGTIRNSVCRGSTGSGLYIETSWYSANYAIRNVTAVASEPYTSGIRVAGYAPQNSPPIRVDIVNTIAMGGAADLALQNAHQLEVRIGHSNFRTSDVKGSSVTLVETPQGSNQDAWPKFADAGAGDFRQAAGSPTIDAGVVADANGGFDLDGDKRTIGYSTDIGADEFAVTFRSGGSEPEPGSGDGADPDGSSPETESGPLADGRPDAWVPVEISGRLSRRAWRPRRGAKLRLRVTQPANVGIKLRRRRSAGWRRAGRVELGRIQAGEHRVRLRSPLPSGRKLRPGRYRLVLRAAANGLVVRSTPIRFRVLEPRR